MKNLNFENAIIVIKPTRLEQLKSRFNTTEQAKFYIQQNKVAFAEKKMTNAQTKREEKMRIQQNTQREAEREYENYLQEHQNFYNVLKIIEDKVGNLLKVKVLQQDFLPNYIFSEQDLIIVVGPDGLVANTAKYVNGLPIIGVNPDVERIDGVLLKFTVNDFMIGVECVLGNRYNTENVTMALAKMNDGQQMLAFNDFFVGINSHASAQYMITYKDNTEYQSSSGIIVSTGAGSTGWLSSLCNMTRGLVSEYSDLKKFPKLEFGREENYLIFVVREPFVSKISKANIVTGKITKGEVLKIESAMPQGGIIFSDGIQKDFMEFNVGSIVEIGVADQKAKLVKNYSKTQRPLKWLKLK